MFARLFIVAFVLCLATFATGRSLSTRTASAISAAATAGNGQCADPANQDQFNTCVTAVSFAGTNLAAPKTLAEKRCRCNGNTCTNGHCVCNVGNAWCIPKGKDTAERLAAKPDRALGNDKLKIGWEIEFSNEVNCHTLPKGQTNAKQCALGYKQTFLSLKDWDFTTDNHVHVKAQAPPASVLTAIGAATANQFTDAYVVEMKPHKPIPIRDLKANIIKLAKVYAEMENQVANNEWIIRSTYPLEYDNYDLGSQTSTQSGHIITKATPNEREWGQIEYKTVYGRKRWWEKLPGWELLPNAQMHGKARWWVKLLNPNTNVKAWAPSQANPQITKGFLLSEVKLTNPFLSGRMDPASRQLFQQALSGVNFNSVVPDATIRNWVTLLVYFAQIRGSPMKQAIDPLPKFDICELSAKVMARGALPHTTTALGLDAAFTAGGNAVDSLKNVVNQILARAHSGHACRLVPGDTSVFAIDDFGQNDWIVVMEMRNPTGPCVDLVKYGRLKLDPNDPNELDDDSLDSFWRCYKEWLQV